MKTQKTAVEQFANYLLKHKQSNSINGIDYVLIQVNEVEQLKKQAKEMEKEQIIDSWRDGFINGRKSVINEDFSNAIQYFNEIYGGNI